MFDETNKLEIERGLYLDKVDKKNKKDKGKDKDKDKDKDNEEESLTSSPSAEPSVSPTNETSHRPTTPPTSVKTVELTSTPTTSASSSPSTVMTSSPSYHSTSNPSIVTTISPSSTPSLSSTSPSVVTTAMISGPWDVDPYVSAITTATAPTAFSGPLTGKGCGLIEQGVTTVDTSVSGVVTMAVSFVYEVITDEEAMNSFAKTSKRLETRLWVDATREVLSCDEDHQDINGILYLMPDQRTSTQENECDDFVKLYEGQYCFRVASRLKVVVDSVHPNPSRAETIVLRTVRDLLTEDTMVDASQGIYGTSFVGIVGADLAHHTNSFQDDTVLASELTPATSSRNGASAFTPYGVATWLVAAVLAATILAGLAVRRRVADKSPNSNVPGEPSQGHGKRKKKEGSRITADSTDLSFRRSDVCSVDPERGHPQRLSSISPELRYYMQGEYEYDMNMTDNNNNSSNSKALVPYRPSRGNVGELDPYNVRGNSPPVSDRPWDREEDTVRCFRLHDPHHRRQGLLEETSSQFSSSGASVPFSSHQPYPLVNGVSNTSSLSLASSSFQIPHPATMYDDAPKSSPPSLRQPYPTMSPNVSIPTSQASSPHVFPLKKKSWRL